jgi:hypothetical protein
MAKFTNYTAGPKGVHGVNGLVYVEPGKTVEIEVSKEEAASAKKTGWFTAPKAVEAPKEDELTDAEVLALLTDRMLENMADDLFDLLKGGAKEGNIFSSIASFLGGIPKFSTGVENFGGGLAYVHKGEVLANLSAGTSVIPAHAVQAMGAAGGGAPMPSLVRVMVNPSPYFDVQVRKVAAPGSIQAGMASYQASEAQRQRAARIAPYARR